MIYNDSFTSKSATEIIRLLGQRFRDYRLRMALTQAEVATRAGVSVLTVIKFESGRAENVSMRTFLSLLRSIGSLGDMADVLPELPPDPYATTHSRQRIKSSRP